MSGDADARISARAAGQHGVVTRPQLLEAGLSPGSVHRRLRAGRLRRLYRGIYLVGSLLPPLARPMAAVLAAGSEGLLSHLSAGWLWDLQVRRNDGRAGVIPSPTAFEDDRIPLDVTVAGHDRGRRPGIRTHRVVALAADERAVVEGIPVTSPGRTLADLAGSVGSRELEQAVARAQRARLLAPEELKSLPDRYRGRPGIPMLRALLEVETPPAFTRSEAEERFLSLIRTAGLPPPQTNALVGGAEVDFLWPARGLAVEVDGFHFHSSRASFESDRRRDTRLATLGIQVIRLSWRQIVDDSVATAVQLGQALVTSRRGATEGPIGH